MQGGGAVEQIQGEIHLPPECLGHIMTFVADEDYYNAMQVSREWMAAARCSRSPFWWVNFFLPLCSQFHAHWS